MGRPSQMEVFDTLYGIAARDGREQALFGRSVELARPAFQKTLIGEDYPSAYLEFPLVGEPRFDLLSVSGCVPVGARFVPGAGFGYQPVFDWFSNIEAPKTSLGIEVDCGSGERERAGLYLQQRRSKELVGPFLAAAGEPERECAFNRICSRMPRGWPLAYAGLFPGRPGSPLRVGGYLRDFAHHACAGNPGALARAFDSIGFSAYDEAMLKTCATLMALAPAIDFQFDILSNGELGDTFGLSLSFNEVSPRQARDCMETGFGARIMRMFEAQSLADDRWRLIADAVFARSVEFRTGDTTGRLALCVLMNFAKLKFCAGKAQPAKFYLVLKAKELDRGRSSS